MKKITKIITATAVILLLFGGCKKDDIRDKYTGDWDFITEKATYEQDDLNNYELVRKDTVYYSGKINLGNLEDQLIIQFTENDEVLVAIDTKGKIWQAFPSYYLTCHKCAFGEFEKKDKMYLDRIHQVNEKGLIGYYVNGTKMKGGKK